MSSQQSTPPSDVVPIDPSKDGNEIVSTVGNRVWAEFLTQAGLADLLTPPSSLSIRTMGVFMIVHTLIFSFGSGPPEPIACHIGWHDVANLVQHGCPPRLALHIVR